MILRKKNDESNELKVDDLVQQNIDQIYDENDYTSDGTTTMVNNLDKLTTIASKPKPNVISKETWLAVGSNLAGVLLVLNHERLYPVTSKAFSFLRKTL